MGCGNLESSQVAGIGSSPVLCEASTRFSHRHRDIEKPCASESSDCPLCVTQVAHWPTAVSQTSLVGGTSTSLDNPEDSLARIHGASHHGPKFSGTDSGMFDPGARMHSQYFANFSGNLAIAASSRRSHQWFEVVKVGKTQNNEYI